MTVKRITTLGSEPMSIGLADRACSLFIDPQSGDIFLDEGEGEDRINGAVLFATKGPRFHITPLPNGGALLTLIYRHYRVNLGVSDDERGLRRWADAANRWLKYKSQPSDTVIREINNYVCPQPVKVICDEPGKSMSMPFTPPETETGKALGIAQGDYGPVSDTPFSGYQPDKGYNNPPSRSRSYRATDRIPGALVASPFT